MSDWKLLNTSTASGASSVEFTDLTGYKIFKFVCIDIHPETALQNFGWQASTDGGSSYGMTITSTAFAAMHDEPDATAQLIYKTAQDLAQSTSDQQINYYLDANADDSTVAELTLFNPASTTYVKHFYCTSQGSQGAGANPHSTQMFSAGYINSTSDVDAVIFRFSSGNMNGVIKQYGLVAS